jgi:hypothetical protein
VAYAKGVIFMATGRVSTTYEDGNGYSASSDVYINVPAGGTLANLQTEFGALAALINNVTACKITKMSFHIDVDLSGLIPNAPSDLVSVNAALGLAFPNATNSRPWDYIVPGLAGANKIAGHPDMSEGNAIDLLADTLEVNMGTAGLTAGYYANNQFLKLAPIARGYFPDRKLARKLRSRSSEIGS